MVKRKLYIVLVLAAVGALLLWSVALGEDLPGNKIQGKTLSKVTGNPQYQILNINNITTWTRYDGESNHTPGGDNGVYYPVGTGNVVYEDGFIWGAKIFLNAAKTSVPTVQPIRVEGSTYSGSGYVGIKAGRVIGSGATAAAANPNDADVRCYRIRRDYFGMSDAELTYDAQTSNELAGPSDVSQSMKDRIYQQYDTDWKNWPVAQGAPYIERNGIPGYQAPPAFSATFTPDNLISGKYDEPGVAGSDPNSPADQVIWNAYNDLDGTQTIKFTGSQPTGVEVQKTVWGYKRTDAMGNIYFSRYRMINKGGVDVGGGVRGSFWLDSVYVCQWSDIDLGNSGDDLVGCDSIMSLAYTYNGNPVDNTFVKFGLPPPASGYDFLAGPEVPAAATDSAIFNYKYIKGKKNLPMSSFVYFSAGSPYSDPAGPTGASGYALTCFQWYAMLRGYAPAGVFGNNPSRYLVPPGVDPNTRFMMSGDPVTHTGFIDGLGTNYSFAPGDRRMLLDSGPFSLAPGDTQEVYVGFVVGLGADRLSSISVMKFNDQFVQNTFDALFQVPKPPPAPKVSIAELNQKVVLDWADDASVTAIEKKFSEPGHYRFEGYNVYQFPAASSTLADAKRLATYDTPIDPAVVTDLQPVSGVIVAVPVQFGTNSGITRHFVFTEDKIKDIAQIYNGQEYYIAVTAYSVATVAGYLPNALESPPLIYTVVPKSSPFGMQYGGSFGDTLAVTKTGTSDGKVLPIVMNPAALTGSSYKVGFDSLGWYLTNTTTGKKLLSAQQNQLGDGNYLTVEGMQVKVTGPPNPGMIEWSIPNGTRQFSPVNGWNAIGLEGFSNAGDPVAYAADGTGTIGMPMNFPFWGTSLTIADMKNTLLKLAVVNNTALWDPKATPTDANMSRGYRWLRGATAAPADPSFAPWIVNTTAAGTYKYQDFNYSVPFSAWNVETTPPTRLAVGLFENNATGGLVDGRYWPQNSSGTVTGATTREMAFIFASAYSATPVAKYMVDVYASSFDMMWIVACARRGEAAWAAGNEFLITAAHVNNPSVSFTFSSPAAVATTDLAKTSLNKITVFPNPYYGINSAETSRFNKFISFTNMPVQATVRIFNLAGQLVRVLQKNDQSTFFKWDLLNSVNYPVASGMYIAYIDVPNVGSKVVKMAVIQEQELLDLY
jgi:hypothetical protein